VFGCAEGVTNMLSTARCHRHVLDDMQDKQTVDPNRVGGPTNALLGENALSTTIGAATGAAMNDPASRNLQRLAARWGFADAFAGGGRRLVDASCACVLPAFGIRRSWSCSPGLCWKDRPGTALMPRRKP